MDQEKQYGNYDAPWTKTFDLVFLIGWIIALAALTAVTLWGHVHGKIDREFIFFSLTKIIVVGAISLVGGILCRKFCGTDEKGYIIYTKPTLFKVNYTRKLQHFAAYLVPLINPMGKHEGLIPHLWETLFVMLTFLLLIKPLRENCRFFMLQFNSMDRPEDRPNTLKWIILGNLLPGLLISVYFQNIFEKVLNEPYLVMIVVLAVSIGDGLAEPVGIYLGKHKYTVPAWNFKRRYTRSYEGSACVFLTTLIAVLIFKGDFQTARQFIAALIILPPLMTFAEAFAPHSMDTPVMMLSGYTVLAGISCWGWF